MWPTIDIAICFDHQIEAAALVMLASVRAHAVASRPTKVYAITDGVSAEGERLLGEMRTEAFSVEVIKVSNAFIDMQSRGYISVGTYLRFFIPEVLPHLEKVLYLDIDLIVRRNVSPLYDVPLGDHPLAAVPDFSQINSGLTWRPWRIEYEDGAYTFADYSRQILSVRVDGKRPYFNCGVLVLNLAEWRRTKLVDKVLAFLRARPNLRFLDQDAINHVVGPNYVRLDLRWNAFAIHASPIRMHPVDQWTARGRDWLAVRALWRSDPWIVHYAGPNKPWSPTDEPTPFDCLWWEAARSLPNYAAIEKSYRAARDAGSAGFDKSARRAGAASGAAR